MSAAFFRDLEMDEPALNLEVGGGSHGTMTGEMMRRLEPALAERRPDGVLVYGDTNSTLAAAVVAAKLSFDDGRRPWLAHVEAGLRSFNRRMPEERNRIVADHLADLLLAPTPAAMANLGREGLAERAELVGDVMVDAHVWASAQAGSHLPAAAREHAQYVLLTLHRAENVDDPDRLARILEGLAVGLPVVFPVHPRTRNALERAGLALPPNVVARRAGRLPRDGGPRSVRGGDRDRFRAASRRRRTCPACRASRCAARRSGSRRSRPAGIASSTPIRPRSPQALADETFMRRDRPRPPLFGDGEAARRIVAALERHHDSARPAPDLQRRRSE